MGTVPVTGESGGEAGGEARGRLTTRSADAATPGLDTMTRLIVGHSAQFR
jgi:hypothetical protein